MTRLSVKLFGSLQATAADSPLHFATDKVRALLAYLVVEQGRPHRREVLAALLWPDQPDEQARRNLRLTLHRLKQALDAAASDDAPLSDSLLTTSRTAVQWEPDVAQVDYVQFITLLTQTENHDHPSLTSCDLCLEQLETAVSLVQGDLLAGLSLDDALPFEEWLLVQREFIHHRTLWLYAVLAETYEGRGNYGQALTYAQRQLALEPWYEAAHRQAMRAMVLNGERERALAQFENCRKVLWQELGVEPTVETAVLHQQICDNTFTGQPVTVPLHHIPADLPPFIGRSQELTHITNELSNPACRLLTLVGPGGMGKTRLAIQAANHFAAGNPAHCEAVYFVPLTTARTRQTAVTILAEKLGITLSGEGDSEQAVLQHLRPQKWLLVLDNLEQLPDAAALVAAILQEAPHVQIVATAREPLQISAERRLLLAGLPYPANVTAEDVATSPAEALFIQRARQMVPDFRLDDAAKTAVIKLCQLVEGLPLALELAAGWVRMIDCVAILHETEQNLAFLATTMQEIPERHRSLHAIFSQTWSMLPEPLQRLLVHAAHFPSAFSLSALQGVLPDVTMLDVAVLLDKSLLRRADYNHYELHPLFKQFAMNQPGLSLDWQELFSRYYLRAVAQREAILFGPSPQDALYQIRYDLANVRQAWLWGAALQLWTEIGAALRALGRFYRLEGLFVEAVTGIEQVLPLLDEATETAVLRCRLCLHDSFFLGQQGQYGPAITQAEAAQTLAADLADVVLEGRAYACIGEWQRHQGQYTEAEDALDTAVTLLAETVTPYLAASHNEMGFVHLGRGQYRAARDAFQTALTLYQELDDQTGTAVTLGNLGYVMQMQADYGRARDFLQQALAIAQKIGDRQSIVKHTLGLGWVSLQQGDMDQAHMHQQSALQLASEMGYLRGILMARRHMADASLFQNKLEDAYYAYKQVLASAQRARLLDLSAHVTGNLGIIHARRGEYDDAIRQYEAAIALCRELNDPVSLCRHLGNLGGTYRRLGQYEAAQHCATEVLTVARAVGRRQSEANALVNLGAVYRWQGDLELAQAHFEQALEIYTEVSHQDGIAKSLVFLGLLLQQKGELQAAIECFETSRSSSEDLGDWLSAAVCRLNLGDVYLELGELDTAAHHLLEAQACFRELNSRSYLAAVLVTEARLKLYQGQLAAAQLVVDEALALAEAVGAPEVLSEGQALQAQIVAALERGTAA